MYATIIEQERYDKQMQYIVHVGIGRSNILFWQLND